MFRFGMKAAILAATLIAAALTTPAHAGPQDFKFELVGPPAKIGKDMMVKVRLVFVPDNKPVTGAVIFQSRFDMGPAGMAEMTAPVEAVPGTSAGEAGVYQFKTQPSMAGNWALKLSAKVPGEPATVTGTVTVSVPK